jgi:hypothetical protein
MALDIHLHPKQLEALTTPANEVLYGGAVGGGKALALDTPMLTTTGWKTMETLEVGDQVFDENGKPCNVLAKSDIVYDNTYKVSFLHNISLVCDGRHEWATISGKDRRNRTGVHKVHTTEEIGRTLRVEADKRANHYIYATKPLQFPTKEQPMPAYMFGMWLAGGFLYDKKCNILKQQSVSKGSTWQLTEYEGGRYTNPAEMKALLDKVGVSDDNKHIPFNYLYGDVEQRIALLQGFLDIVGSIYVNSQTEIQFKTYELASDINFLVISLGHYSQVANFDYVSNKNDTNFRVRFYPKMPLSRTSFKLARYEKVKRNAIMKMHVHYTIINVEKIPDVPKQCIQVDSPNHLYLAGEHLIPTHNSFLMRVAAIIWAMECPGLQIYLFRLTRKELEDNHMIGPGAFHELLSAAVNSGFVKINNTAYQIQFRNGANNSFMNGSIIHLCHCQYEKDMYKYQGAEMGVLMIDEATHFSKAKYEFLRTRVRLPTSWEPPKAFAEKWGKKFFPRILLGTNPGGISHNFLRREFVKIVPPLSIVQMPKNKGGMLRQFIPATLDDNPTIDREEYEGRVMAVGNEATARMLLEGDWDAVAGGMFDDVWDASTHMIEPFEIPESWYVDRAFDWGSAVPFSVGWYAESDGTEITTKKGETITYPAGTIFRIAEWYGWTGEEDTGLGLTGYEIGEGIKQKELEDPVFKTVGRVHPGPADNQIWNSNPKIDSMFSSIAHEINAGYYGKASYRLFDIFTRSDKTQGANLRGWAQVRSHLKNSLKYPNIDTGTPCLFFFNTCVHVGRVLPIIERDKANIEEISKGQEDHIMDEIKYRLTHKRQATKRIKTRLG